MTAWEFVAKGGVSVFGALLFLRMIANHVEREADWLDEYEQKEKSAFEKRRELMADVDSVEVVRSSGGV